MSINISNSRTLAALDSAYKATIPTSSNETIESISLSCPQMQNKLVAWAGSNASKLNAAQRIVDFIEGRKSDELDLSHLQLDSLPDIFDNSKFRLGLISINLSHNQLQNFPETLMNLVWVERIDISNNLISALPESIDQFMRLVTLNLSGNQLRSIPDSIGNCYRLRSLDLRNVNNLTSLPNSIIKLSGHCDIFLENSGISAQELDRLRVIPQSLTPPGFRV